ncbi:MAG: transposase [Opitutales bacterium]|nr:transposase [Opitutales bacterium]
MNNPATAIHPALSKYAAVIGLDWAHGQHACALRLADQVGTEHFRVGAKLPQLRAWLAQLKARFKGRPVALCLENNRGLLVRELARHEWIDTYAVNPATAAKYRRMFTPSGDKSDERDAAALLDLLLTHAHKLHAL